MTLKKTVLSLSFVLNRVIKLRVLSSTGYVFKSFSICFCPSRVDQGGLKGSTRLGYQIKRAGSLHRTFRPVLCFDGCFDF